MSNPAAVSLGPPLPLPKADQARFAVDDPRAVRLRKLRQATAGFEALFLAQLLKCSNRAMMGTTANSGADAAVMLEVTQEKTAEALAQQGGVGLGDLLYENMKDRVIADPEPAKAGTEHRAMVLHKEQGMMSLDSTPQGAIPLAKQNAELRPLPQKSTESRILPIQQAIPGGNGLPPH